MSATVAASATAPRIEPDKIRVLDARVLIESIDMSETTEGGIVLPGKAAQDRATTVARVVSVGDGRKTDHGVHIPVRVKPGDFVLVGKFAGVPVGRNEKHKIINEVEILAVLEE